MAKLAKCEGQLVIKRAGGLENEYFETEFTLSDSVETIAQARSIIQAGMLHEKLMKDVPQYKNWRECQVVSLESTSEVVETSEFEQLLLQCSEYGCVPENLSSYGTDASKTKALQKAIERHHSRIAAQEAKDKAEAILKLAGA
jgi:hypothetical protein